MTKQLLPSSFRDPSGSVFLQDDEIYREVKAVYKENYDHLINSGLYKTLVDLELLIPHKEVDGRLIESINSYKIIKPELIPFISYPYEWCFSQLKDAALLTLKIQKNALDYEMTLKDSSAYNIQFKNVKPILIDTLSFEKYKEDKPWVAYKQFCEHFLAPLALMSNKDIRLNQLLKIYLDGIPLDLTSSLLPFKSYLNPSLLFHIHLHAKSQKHYETKIINKSKRFNKFNLAALIDSLESIIKNLKWDPAQSNWSDYYKNTNYSSGALNHKKEIIESLLLKTRPKTVIDLGANEGLFSQIASKVTEHVISFDLDPICVEKNYLDCLKNQVKNILPLIIDLTNPSGGTGWENKERMSFQERFCGDTILALALIHHLAISNNVPLKNIARFFSSLGKTLIIEFIPKSDSQVQRLLSSREDIFLDYTQESFENEFKQYFTIEYFAKIKDSKRVIYHMQRN